MYPVNLRTSTGRISGGRHTPTSGCATSNLVKSRRPCMYPGHGGFLCAGMMGQKRNSFMARLKFAEKHGQRMAYSWFNSIKKPYYFFFLECKLTGKNGSHDIARSV